MRSSVNSVRRTKKQRGGASWKLPNGDHPGQWETEINLLAEPLKTALLPLVKAGSLRNPEDKKHRLEAYLSAIEHQDELFNMALTLIKKGLKIDVSTEDKIIENSMAIDAKKTLAVLFIKDVEEMVAFKEDTVEDVSNGLSKLQSIKKADEHLSALLLFPERLNNIFIQSLANLFVLLKKNPDNRKKITTNSSTIRLATDQYISNIYANARLLTSFDLRDGFFMNQGINEFQQIMEGSEGASFYSELLTNINKTDALNLSRASSWDKKALAVFRWYLETELTPNYDRSSVLQYMIRNSSIIGEAITSDTVTRQYSDLLNNFPEKEYYEIPLDDKGTTLLSMLNIMGPEELEFVLHLAYTLWKSHFEQQATPA